VSSVDALHETVKLVCVASEAARRVGVAGAELSLQGRVLATTEVISDGAPVSSTASTPSSCDVPQRSETKSNLVADRRTSVADERPSVDAVSTRTPSM
jgi:hypothetical protein